MKIRSLFCLLVAWAGVATLAAESPQEIFTERARWRLSQIVGRHLRLSGSCRAAMVSVFS